MIYCVIPEGLADELYEKLAEYYRDNPNVEVMIERRKKDRRARRESGGKRKIRDRRRARIPGTFPDIEPKGSG